MCHFIESIRLENGIVKLLDYHQDRMDRTIFYHFGFKNPVKISKLLEERELPINGVYKIRILYSQMLQNIEIIPYQQKNYSDFEIIELPDHFNYAYKFADRTLFETLSKHLNAQSIAIFSQKSMLTDALYANLIFQKNGFLYTPNTPLLNGVQRQFLLEKNKISEINISIHDIYTFEKVGLINAMIPLENIDFINL
jgi:4-amino-4-deoxychorismate lyase